VSFELAWSARALSEYESLQQAAAKSQKSRRAGSRSKASRQAGLFKQVTKAIQLLAQNPRQPGLNSHKYAMLENPHQRGGDVFGIYAQNQTAAAYRVFWCYGPGKRVITIIAITAHP